MKKYKGILIGCLIALTALSCLLIWIVWSNISVKTTGYTIENNRIPDSFSGFRIAQVSDLHNAEFGTNNSRLLSKLEKAEPDVIVITGDLIDSSHTDIQIAVDFCKKAIQIAPVYYSSGNHEAWSEEYPRLLQELTNAGVTILQDQSVLLGKNSQQIQLIGINDQEFQKDYTSQTTAEVIKSCVKTKDYTVLLSHRPEFFSAYIHSGVDLVFSGHAHGGQFRIPLIGGIYAPYQGFFPEYDSGIYTEESTTMVVSRGLGNSIKIPRINNRPEIVIVELKN